MKRQSRVYGHASRPTSLKAVGFYFVIGILIGVIGGYVLMGTSHAVFESRGAPHYDDGQQQLQAQSIKSGTSAAKPAKAGHKGKTMHALCPTNGSPYQNYQMRIAYGTYQIIQGMPGGENHVGFTRILHRTVPDELMDQVPTFHAQPLQPKCDGWCEYPVSDRPNAVRQFLDAAKKDPSMIKGEWIYMIESDYVFMKPLSPPDAADASKKSWAFPFSYIHPAAHGASIRKLFPESSGSLQSIPRSGPAPALLRLEEWQKVTPEWERLTAEIERDEAMKKDLGWVREMYAFSVALAAEKVEVELPSPPRSPFIVQLPIDTELGDAHAFHYTQCTIYKTLDDKDVWAFDKRFYTAESDALRPKLLDEPPPFEEGKWKFIEGQPVRRAVHDSITTMIKQMNRAIAGMEDLSGKKKP